MQYKSCNFLPNDGNNIIPFYISDKPTPRENTRKYGSRMQIGFRDLVHFMHSFGLRVTPCDRRSGMRQTRNPLPVCKYGKETVI